MDGDRGRTPALDHSGSYAHGPGRHPDAGSQNSVHHFHADLRLSRGCGRLAAQTTGVGEPAGLSQIGRRPSWTASNVRRSLIRTFSCLPFSCQRESDRKMEDRKMADRKMEDRKMEDRKMTDRKMEDRKMPYAF